MLMKAEIKDKETGETYHIELDEPIEDVDLPTPSFKPSVGIKDNETMKMKLKDKETGETSIIHI